MAIKERQLDIIEAAGSLLNSSGLGGLTIKNLAAEMSFSESALYRHFSGKEEIIIAMLDYLAQNMDERLSKAVKESDSPRTKFKNLFADQFHFFNTNRHFVVAVFSDCLMEESPRINDRILHLMEIKTKHVFPVIVEGQKTGAFTSKLPAEELMHIVLGSFRLQMFNWRSRHFDFNIEERGEFLIQSLLSLMSINKP